MRFPLFLELAGTSCLVVGAGEVALWKKRVLEEYGAQVQLTTDFMPEQVEGRTLVVAATNDRSVNRQVYEACCARKIPVNVVDDPELCTFVFPAVAKKGPLLAAVTTDGKTPVATQYLRDEISKLMTDRLVAAVEHLSADRERIKRERPALTERRDWYRKELEKWLGRED